MRNYLYTYTDCRELMYINSQLETFEKSHDPMNNKDYIKIHKGIDNNIRFNVADPDYKKASVDHLDVKAVIIDPNTREVVFEKYLENVDGCSLYLRALEGEIKDIKKGHYEMVVRGENKSAYVNQQGFAAYEGFYKDHANNITFPVLVSSQGDTYPIPSAETKIEDWLPVYEQNNSQPTYYSPPLPSNLTRNTMNRNHTFAVIGEEAGGIIKVYGTLEASPTMDENLWFQLDVPSSLNNEIKLEDFTGIQAWTFSANLTWVRFQWIPDQNPPQQGNLKKIQYRN